MRLNKISCSLSSEGPSAGLRTVFVRTYGCNLECVHCNAEYARTGNEFNDVTLDDILHRIAEYDCKRVTLTGGEPLLQKESLELINVLAKAGYSVELETNGSIDVSTVKDLMFDNVTIVMSWKCATSGELNKMLESNLGELDYQDIVKCVVESKEDLDEAVRIKDLTNAQIYLNPISDKLQPSDITNYIMENKLNDVRLQVRSISYLL